MTEYSTSISSKEKMQMLGNMSTMLKAGIPILEAVNSLLDEAKGNQKKILEVMVADLQAGTLIHESFAKYPHTFNKVTVNLVKAAEEAGTLEVALKDAKETLQKEMEFEDKVRSAMMYPAFVLAVFIGVMLTMLIVVMPRIAQVFTRLRMDLPLATRVLIGASNALINHSVISISVTAVVVILLIVLYKFQKRALTNAMFSVPGISGLVRQVDLTRFSRSMTLLLGSGLPIVSALELAEDVVVKKDLRDLLKESREKISAGKRFSEGLYSNRKLVPGIVIKLIEVGERTGTLNESMKDITEMLDYEVTKNLRSATTLLEPIMLVFVGLAVGAMMLSIIGPIYGLISNVSVR